MDADAPVPDDTLEADGEEEDEEDYAAPYDWEQQVAEAMQQGDPLIGLPRGLRIRSKLGSHQRFDEEASPRPAHASLRVATAKRWEFCILAGIFVLSAMATVHFFWSQLLPRQAAHDAWRHGCSQCKPDWWHRFWKWRLDGSSGQAPPPGMEWEWSSSVNNTDWYGASAEFVDEMVRTFADPGLGPVLQVGCGDSPIPELLHRAGFPASEHIDIIAEVIDVMKQRYPAADWPGLSFQVRDFLAPPSQGGGAPLPAGRFSAVLDKAGIWDWLQEDAPAALPHLLEAVRQALVPPPAQGVYIIATKQSPAELSERLTSLHSDQAFGFHVEATRKLGGNGVAWAYVLSQV